VSRIRIQGHCEFTADKARYPAVIPDMPNVLSPNEGFTFSISVQNTAYALGGIRLINVGYHISVADSSKAKLIVPPATVGRATSSHTFPAIVYAPGTEQSGYYLVPPEGHDIKALDAGETDTIAGLRGIAKALGTTQIRVHILADPDLDYIFPKREESATAQRSFTVM